MTKLVFKTLLPTFGLALICMGCALHRVDLTPHVAGRIIDQSTKEPIPNATIYFQDFPEHVSLSADEGYFDISALHHMYHVSEPTNEITMSQLLNIRAYNFQPIQKTYTWTGLRAPDETNEIFYLKPIERPHD